MLLGSPVITAERVFIAWSCRGMLAPLGQLAGKFVALVIDGKQKLFREQYTIVTVGMLVKRQTRSSTTAGRRGSKRVQVEGQTCTMRPLAQALANAETEENILSLFAELCKVAHSLFQCNLKDHVVQVHKDFGPGLEAARRSSFPNSRPCNDYPHMCRAVHSHFKLLKLSDKESGSLVAFSACARVLPTVPLFDAVWRVMFWMLKRGTAPQRAAGKYLQERYFQAAPAANLAKVFGQRVFCWKNTSALFAPYWPGPWLVVLASGSAFLLRGSVVSFVAPSAV